MPKKTWGGVLALRNWRVRSRLIALVLVPTITGVALGGVQIVSSVNVAAEYGRAGELAAFAITLGKLANEVQMERDLSARFVGEGRRGGTTSQLLREQHTAVDRAVGEVRSQIDAAEQVTSSGEGTQHARLEIAEIRSRLSELNALRDTATKTVMEPSQVIDLYSGFVTDLLAVHDEIGRGVTDNETLTGDVIAYAALARAKEQASRERAILAVAIPARNLSGSLLDAFVSARARRDSEIATFRAHGDTWQRQLYDDTVTGQKVDRAELIRIRALAAANGQLPPGAPSVLTPSQLARWFDSQSDTIKRMREVEEVVSNAILETSWQLREEEQSNAMVIGSIVGFLLLVVLVITVIVARSLVSPLRKLRTEALSIAGERLPATVQAIRETGELSAAEISPIGVISEDEIGEVARAFDEVHREAVRLAGQEATLRSNVNAMFVNLSRRSQTLVERQLSLIENLEQGEQDEERLGNLFRLDHLATRMRRNSENLLVLAGQEPARRWGQPVPLVDVVRAALSEVENYERVAVNVPSGPAVAGTAVNDVVHLIAELVENAISFSPRETKVTVTSTPVDGGGMMISVSDLGIGMTAEEIAQANWRLANPPVVDVSVSRRMGLFVVGRLALRHGIRVQLRHQDSGGLTAMVLLPDTLVTLPGPAQGGGYGRPAGTGHQPAMAGHNLFDIGAQQAGTGNSMFGDSTSSFDSFTPRNGNRYGASVVDTPWPDRVPPPGAGEPGYDHPSYGSPASFGSHPSFGSDYNWSFSSLQSLSSSPMMPPAPPPAEPPQDTGPLRRFGREDVTTGPLRRFDREEYDTTGPLPAVHSSPVEAEEDFLPIYAAVESDWFRRAEPVRKNGASADKDGDRDEGQTASRPAETPKWTSPADAGWQAARAASDPTLGGITRAGLPKRVPKANLVPGSAATTGQQAQNTLPRRTVSPDVVRNRLASFQQGVRRGRAAARGELDGDTSSDSSTLSGDGEDS